MSAEDDIGPWSIDNNDEAVGRELFERIIELVDSKLTDSDDDLGIVVSALVNELGVVIFESVYNSPEEVKRLIDHIVEGLTVTVTKNLELARERDRKETH